MATTVAQTYTVFGDAWGRVILRHEECGRPVADLGWHPTPADIVAASERHQATHDV